MSVQPLSADVERVADTLVLRFVGREGAETPLHELRAAHVAEVLQGLAGIAGDFAKAGVFGDGPGGSEVLVRPAKSGSFVIEIFRAVMDNPDYFTTTGTPSLGVIIWWATRSVRAGVKDFEHLANGNVKIVWQDNLAEEVPLAAWEELNKRKRRRKKQLRDIMRPLSDPEVQAVELTVGESDEPATETDPQYTLTKPDYDAARPDNDVNEYFETFDVEARMSALDFDDPTKWRVKTADQTRSVTVEDDDFLGRVSSGLAIRNTDVFRLQVRQVTVEKNGQTRRYWTILKVESHRRAAHDDAP